jgi:hypothetical protein
LNIRNSDDQQCSGERGHILAAHSGSFHSIKSNRKSIPAGFEGLRLLARRPQVRVPLYSTSAIFSA